MTDPQAVNDTPRTAEGRALLAREDYNARSFALITAEAILAIEDAAFALGVAAAQAAVEGLRAPSEDAAYGVIGYNLGIDAALAALDRLTE